MKRIILGKSGGKNIGVDLDVLMRTRLLVQANSGGGKSWLLRRLAEQLFGHVPVIIIDPEGEFATLREKYGYVLVGKGGETPADIRSAGIVAHKLLELRASAVCDLYEMKPHERHHWVRVFLEALIDAPKNLWRPTIIAVDEAHTFCPEKGAGESEASEAMTALPTRGRKRRFCAIWATQRLGKLRKDASAELLNRLVGPTFEDVDLKRAAELLSIESKDRRAFDQQMRVLEPGNFFALGRALCKDRQLVQIGPVQTSHELQDAQYGIEPPPPPEKVKALLPKLADLPQKAEEKARTEKELRSEIRDLKSQIAAAEKLVGTAGSAVRSAPAAPAKPKIEIVNRPVLTDKQCEDLGKKIDNLIHYTNKVGSIFGDIAVKVVAGNDTVRTLLQRQAADQPVVGRVAPRGDSVPQPRPTVAPALRSVAPRPAPVSSPRPRVASPVSGNSPPANGDYRPGRCERALMRVFSQFSDGILFAKLALCSGYSQTSSSFEKAIGILRTQGIIVGSNTELMRPSDRLEKFGPFEPLPSGGDLIDHWLNFPQFGGCERAVLKAICEHPDGLLYAALGEAAKKPDGSSYSATSSSFEKAVGRLRTAGLIQGRNTDTIRPSDDLLEALNS